MRHGHGLGLFGLLHVLPFKLLSLVLKQRLFAESFTLFLSLLRLGALGLDLLCSPPPIAFLQSLVSIVKNDKKPLFCSKFFW